MEIFIIEDDRSVINILEDIIDSHDLGHVCGSSDGTGLEAGDVMSYNPDVILVDFLMPVKDGIQVVRELRELGCTAKCIMISQVSAKEMIGKAYDAGIDFFISKPINFIEVKSVIENVSKQIRSEKTLLNIRKMFMTEMASAPIERKEDKGLRKQQHILNQLGMSGEKGSGDLMKICQYLHSNRIPISQISIGQLCDLLSDNPKNMEQRMRRAIAVGMSNLAHLGIEDFMNETFISYSGSLFHLEAVKAEMDFIRGKSKYGGKINIKKFIDSLMVFAEQAE